MLRENLRNTVTANYPQVISLEREINTSRNVLLENIGTLRSLLNNRLRSTQGRLNSYSGKLPQLPKKEQELTKVST